MLLPHLVSKKWSRVQDPLMFDPEIRMVRSENRKDKRLLCRFPLTKFKENYIKTSELLFDQLKCSIVNRKSISRKPTD